ncbi:MAG: hypothetical protein ACE5G0_06590 [Rhodothermales bacterium]
MSRSLIVGGVLMVGLLAARSAAACSCVVPPPPQEALEEATVVFVGKVLSIDREDDLFPMLRVTLWVKHPIKGFFIETIEVQTARDSAMCGFPFERGERYLVYAHEAEDALHVSLCSRTARLEEAKADLIALGVPDILDEDDDDGGGCGGPSNIAAMQAVLFVLIGVGWVRRKKRLRYIR